MSTKAYSGKEIACLRKKIRMKMMNNDDTKIVKSRGKQEAGRNELGFGVQMSPRDVALCFQGLARRSSRVRRLFVRGSREISLSPSLYIERLLTL